MKKDKLKIFTWHIHGNYLYYLSQIKSCDFYIPYLNNNVSGYRPLGDSFRWGENIHEVPVENVKELDLDLILFQSNYPSFNIFKKDRFTIFSKNQQELPKIYLEHDPPRKHPTDTKHIVDDPNILIVHVTNFNNLMWDNNNSETRVIEHGVTLSKKVPYKGDLERGVVIVNNLKKRGRRLGLDIYKTVKKEIPLDLIGMNSKELGGVGDISYDRMPDFLSRYRFVFYPIRYTSLGLSLCESMMVGLPVIGLGTTELVTVIKNGVSGFIDTDVNSLIKKMKFLLDNKNYAEKLSIEVKKVAEKRFNIERFINEWEQVFNNKIATFLKLKIHQEVQIGVTI